MHICIITHRPKNFTTFLAALTKKGVETSLFSTGEAALAQVRLAAPTLVVVDEDLPDMASFALVSQLLQVNAFIHTAVVSQLSSEEFHEASEGLGILTSLPLQPSTLDADALLKTLLSLT